MFAMFAMHAVNCGDWVSAEADSQIVRQSVRHVMKITPAPFTGRLFVSVTKGVSHRQAIDRVATGWR